MELGFDFDQLSSMAHSAVRNYAIPGLTSWLIGGNGHGAVRLFSCEREHQEAITPHSHRFDFQCVVLKGRVRNRIWTEVDFQDPRADRFLRTQLLYAGEMGHYEKGSTDCARFAYEDYTYGPGEVYRMDAHEIHSIYFDRDTEVLFFEGPNVNDHSVILEPYCNVGGVVPTFEVRPWMFKRD